MLGIVSFMTHLIMALGCTDIPRSENTLRRQIAALAARIMAEEGVSDFGFAKRRAARRLGGGITSLPNNAEIETQLRSWQALYQDGEHDMRLRQMRLAAQDLMTKLSDFDPWLVGAVLDGTAGRYSELDIELYPIDSAKDVEIFLLNLGLQPEHREARRMQHPPVPEAILSFDWQEVPVRLVIYPARILRGGKRRGERAGLAALHALLAESEAGGVTSENIQTTRNGSKPKGKPF